MWFNCLYTFYISLYIYILDRGVLSKGSWWNSEGDHSQKGQSVYLELMNYHYYHCISLQWLLAFLYLYFYLIITRGGSLPRWCSHPLTNWTCATLAGDFQCFWPVHTGDGSMPMGLWKWGAWTSRRAPFFDSRFSGFCPVQPGVLVMKHPKGLYLGLLAIQGAHTNYPIFSGWIVIDITAHHLLDWSQLDGPKCFSEDFPHVWWEKHGRSTLFPDVSGRSSQTEIARLRRQPGLRRCWPGSFCWVGVDQKDEQLAWIPKWDWKPLGHNSDDVHELGALLFAFGSLSLARWGWRTG